jgi:hypothetical protein
MSAITGLLYDSCEFNGLFSFTFSGSFIIREGSVIVSTVLIYELFGGEDCGFSAGVDNDSDSNDDGDNDCSDRGISDDCDSDVNMAGTLSTVDDAVTDECDTRGKRDEGLGDEETNKNCDDEVDENNCGGGGGDDGDDDDDDNDNDDDDDSSGIGDDDNDDNDNDDGDDDSSGIGEDGTDGEGGDNDDIYDAVAEEYKDGRLLWMFTGLLAICSASGMSEYTGVNGLLLDEASELLSSSRIVVKVVLCVTSEGVSVEVSFNSCVIFKIGPIDEYVDWFARLESLPELLIIPERIISQDEEFEEAIVAGVGGEGSGLGKGVFFFDASSSPFKTFCTLATTS